MEFKSHIVVASQCRNKKFGPPTPSCFVYKQVNPNLNKTTLLTYLAALSVPNKKSFIGLSAAATVDKKMGTRLIFSLLVICLACRLKCSQQR